MVMLYIIYLFGFIVKGLLYRSARLRSCSIWATRWCCPLLAKHSTYTLPHITAEKKCLLKYHGYKDFQIPSAHKCVYNYEKWHRIKLAVISDDYNISDQRFGPGGWIKNMLDNYKPRKAFE